MDSREKNESRSKKYIRNTAYHMVYFILSMVVSFVLPRLRITIYGSATNGLVSSVTQFLSFITFADLGIGSVTLASYYKPLAEHDTAAINNIYAASKRFYKYIGTFFAIYMGVVLVYFTVFQSADIGVFATCMLVIALSITSFAQYFFGMANGLLLRADQKEFYKTKIDTITLVLNFAACVVLMYMRVPIHWVRLTTACIFMIRPLYLKRIVDKSYGLDQRLKPVGNPIEQKWNGMAQHIASHVNTNTDIVVLTVLGNLGLVSVYYVHHLVTEGIRKLFMVIYQGMLPTFGSIIAVESEKKINSIFNTVEWFSHTAITLMYTCAGLLITPFVLLYTKGVTDADYNTPLFACLLVISQALFCLKTPYQYIYQAAGHFKQTQASYIIEAAINIVISCAMVFRFGLIGVAIGTLIAALYRIVYLVLYLSKNIIHRPVSCFLKYTAVDMVEVALMVFICSLFPAPQISAIGWLVYALEVFGVCAAICFLVNVALFKNTLFGFAKRFFGKIFAR